MKDFIQYYTNPFEKDINFELMNKSYDDDLIKYLVECCESLEILPQVKFDGYEFIEHEHLINMNDFVKSRKKTKSDSGRYTMDILENRCGELRVKFTLTCKGETSRISKRILVPLQDEDGYFTIKGMKYMLLYQLLESSTYISRNNVTLKSLQAVTLKRSAATIKDYNKEEYQCPIFEHFMFKKPVLVILFYLANFGFSDTLSFFNMERVIEPVIIGEPEYEEDETPVDLVTNNIVKLDKWDDMDIDDKHYYFPISKKLLIRVRKKFFNKYSYVQSIVAMIITTTTNRLRLSDLFNQDFWLEKLDYVNSKNSKKNSPLSTSTEKGYNTLIHFNRMMDKTTTRNLKLSKYHKQDVYAIIRWLMLEYNELKKKDNMDLDNKRLRCHEYIASLLTKHFSDKMSRVINYGKKAVMSDVEQIFKFQGNILLKQLYASGILPFDDRTSDMDFFNKFKFTLKGPNSLGNKNENSISIIYRGIHPSDIGRKDINVCGNSDPGRSGILTPFCKTYGMYFSNKLEPQRTMDDFIEDLMEEDKEKGNMVISIGSEDDHENLKAYDKMMESMDKIQFNIYSENPRLNARDEQYYDYKEL